MCKFSAYVAFNKTTNGLTDIEQERMKIKNLFQMTKAYFDYIGVNRFNSIFHKWHTLLRPYVMRPQLHFGVMHSFETYVALKLLVET